MSFTYLASPYTSPDQELMLARFREAQKATAYLLAERVWVYSPIVHCHELAQLYSLPHHFSFWHDYNFAMLRSAGFLLVLTLDGWKSSKGVQAEIEYAKEMGVPISTLEPNGKGYSSGALPCR